MNCAIIGSTKIAEVHAEQLAKYGVNEICECPQFVSPMKPSQYFDKSYEEKDL